MLIDDILWDTYFESIRNSAPETVDMEDDWLEPQPYHCSKCGAELEDHWKPCKECHE